MEDYSAKLTGEPFLYNETKSKWFIPYIIWNVFATIFSLSVYLLNI